MHDHKIPPSKKDMLTERRVELERKWHHGQPRYAEYWRAVLPWEFVNCKRCHKPALAWDVSKNGKWFLCETFAVEGELEIRMTSRRRFHNCSVPQQSAEAFAGYPEPAAVVH